jgi:hypothetical protein
MKHERKHHEHESLDVTRGDGRVGIISDSRFGGYCTGQLPDGGVELLEKQAEWTVKRIRELVARGEYDAFSLGKLEAEYAQLTTK